MKEDKAVFDALFKLHKIDDTVLISNGTLERLRDNEALVESLKPEEIKFLDLSVNESDRAINLQIEAAQEYSDSLIQAEARADALSEANDRAEIAKVEAEKSKEKAEKLAQEIKKDRDDIAAELESTNQYRLVTDRQRRQFITAEFHGYPAWGLLYIFILGVFLLIWNDKDGVEVLVPVLAGVLGALYQAYSGAFSSLFTPIVREEHKPNAKKAKNDE